MEQKDLFIAFFKCLLKYKVFIERAKGFAQFVNKILIYKLVYELFHALYDLKQSSQEWYAILAVFFVSIGYDWLKFNYSVFIHCINRLIIAIYVDNVLVIGSNSLIIKYFKEQLGKKFCIKNLELVFWYLGMQIIKDWQSFTIYIDQITYVNCPIFRLKIDYCKVTRTSIQVRVEIRKNMHIWEVYTITKKKI